MVDSSRVIKIILLNILMREIKRLLSVWPSEQLSIRYIVCKPQKSDEKHQKTLDKRNNRDLQLFAQRESAFFFLLESTLF